MSVTCSTSRDILHWNVTCAQRTFVRQVSYIGTIQMEEPIRITLTTLYVSRSLDNSSSLSLMSTLSTNSSKADLKGTMITCSGLSYTQLLATDSVEILLVGNNSGSVYTGMFFFC